jgi:hypothetical protein
MCFLSNDQPKADPIDALKIGFGEKRVKNFFVQTHKIIFSFFCCFAAKKRPATALVAL